MTKNKAKNLYAVREGYTIPGYVVEALNKYCEDTQMPKSRVIRMALIDYLHLEKPKPTQTAQE